MEGGEVMTLLLAFFFGFLAALALVASAAVLFNLPIAKALESITPSTITITSTPNPISKPKLVKRPGKTVKVPAPAPLVVDAPAELTPMELDVVGALVNLKMGRKKAEETVRAVVGHQNFETFGELFTATMGVVRQIGKAA